MKWEEFKTNNKDLKLSSAIDLIDEIDINEEKEEEKLLELSNLIKEIKKENYNEGQISILENKFNTLANRRERRVSEGFGQYIKAERIKKGMTLVDLAEASNISASYINRIERAERSSPNIVIVEKIAKGLNVPFIDIVAASGIDLGLKDESETISIEHLIKHNNVSLHKMAPRMEEKEKELLINIVNYISNANWKEDKLKETLEIITLIDNLKTYKLTK